MRFFPITVAAIVWLLNPGRSRAQEGASCRRSTDCAPNFRCTSAGGGYCTEMQPEHLSPAEWKAIQRERDAEVSCRTEAKVPGVAACKGHGYEAILPDEDSRGRLATSTHLPCKADAQCEALATALAIDSAFQFVCRDRPPLVEKRFDTKKWNQGPYCFRDPKKDAKGGEDNDAEATTAAFVRSQLDGKTDSQLKELDPTTVDWKTLAAESDPSIRGKYTLSPSLRRLKARDLEQMVKAGRIKILNLRKLWNHPMTEVAAFVAKTYAAEYYLPGVELWKWLVEHPGKAPPELKADGFAELYFVGSVLGDSDGSWNLPGLTCKGETVFVTRRRKLEARWDAEHDRIVLLKK